MPTQKEKNEKLVEILKNWQKLEDSSVQSTTDIIKKTDNPLVQIVMEIIRQDSVMHRRVQQLIIDHYEKQALRLNIDELAEFWTKIEEHDELEKKVIKLAKEAKEENNSAIVQYLLDYLLNDEEKHDNLLMEMDKIKNKMYPYG
ncbi:MAG: hypothetical protein ACOC2K_04260 [Bacteroidota bacterium]